MKFLIAGYGSIGRRHLNNLLQLGEQDILLYRTHHSTLDEAEIGDIPVETNLKTALGQHPEAAIITNPTALHLDVAIPAAEAGCDLLIEKPISHSFERIPDLERALSQSGAQALVGFQLRFHPGLVKVHELLQNNAIGQPISAHAHWGEYLPNWHPWEDYRLSYSARPDLGGGVVLTLSHPLDYLRWLLGEVEAIWAFTGCLGGLGIGAEDTAEIGLRFANGMTGSLHLDYLQRPPKHTLEVIGSQGTISWDNANGVTQLFTAETGSWESFTPPAGFERNTLFLEEMRHFIQVVKGETEPVCSLEDGKKALELALGALQSSREGRLVKV
jgi:predicted dehydrogenase